MNVKNHAILGLVSGGVIGLLMCECLKNFDLIGTITFILSGCVIGAVIPDILEPPVAWNHRDFFHSQRMLYGLSGIFSILLLSWYLWYYLPPVYLVFGVVSGYLSHLVSDATTRAGLPP